MNRKNVSLILFLCVAQYFTLCFAFDTFLGRISGNNINVRSDSNVTSQIICNVSKDENVEVFSEKYDWYKIKLPKAASAYVKNDLVESIDARTVKAVKDNINVRLAPSESSAVVGRIGKNEIIAVREEKEGWYKIEPPDNCFGWVNKKFVERVIGVNKPLRKHEEPLSLGKSEDSNIILEGIVQPYGKVINRIATHKLITKSYDVFLLKGNPGNLNTFTYHKVKIIGKAVDSPKQKYPVIEIIKMEALD